MASTKRKFLQKEERKALNGFLQCITTKDNAGAYKYLQEAVEIKLQARIEQELETPLFQ